jgi:outer membrane protein TolC
VSWQLAIPKQLAKRKLPCVIASGLFLLVIFAPGASALEQGVLGDEIHFDTTVPSQYTLPEAVDMALRNFPSIYNATYRLRQAQAGITLAKTAYLPNLNITVQEMRATHNVIAGTVMPQANTSDTIPIQSGTVGENSMSSIWGSNQAANFNWLLYDFGERHANVMLACADTKYAQSNLSLTKLDVAYNAADQYLLAVQAKVTIAAEEAALKRMQASELTVRTLVEQGLRPGVDEARAKYDVSEAKIGLIAAEQQAQLAEVDLAESMGVANQPIEIVPDHLINRPPQRFKPQPTNYDTHPLTLLNVNAENTWAAKVHLLDRTWYPHLWWNSAFWGRGSGAPGESSPNAGGILPQVPNYMVGLQVTFPVMDIFAIKARRKEAVAGEMAEKANVDLALQILEQKDARARIYLAQSRRIADETPIMVEAAKENEVKSLERYKTGLANIVAVAEAERILAKADVEDAIAQIQVWRSILKLGYVQGDLQPFLQLVQAAEGVASK